MRKAHHHSSYSTHDAGMQADLRPVPAAPPSAGSWWSSAQSAGSGESESQTKLFTYAGAQI